MFMYNFVPPTEKFHTLNQIRQNHTALYFFVTSFCTLLYGLFILLSGANKNLVIDFNNSNFVIDRFELTILFKIALLVLSIGYFLGQKLQLPLLEKLTNLHIFTTIGSVALSLLFFMVLPDSWVQQVCFWLVIIAIASQSLFIINFAVAIARRNKKSSHQEIL